MFNLVITVGELNADRSNFRYGQLSDTVHQHGACPFKVDFKQRVAEPREAVRGFIARTQFYMHDRYNLRMSEQQQKLFMAWNESYPPSPWEVRRHDRIAAIMGHTNPFLTGEASWSLNQDNRGAGVEDETVSQSDTDNVIRGNRNSKVYHLPEGCPSYTRVSEHNIVPFDSQAQAEAAGYRKAGNCR